MADRAPGRLDLSPAPGPAPAPTRWAAQARLEWRQLMTNGEQLLLTIAIPVAALVAVVQLGLASVPEATAGALALAILSSAFTATAIATGFERRSGVLKYLGTTPLGRTGLLAGKALATLAVIALQCLVIALTAVLMGATGGVASPVALVVAVTAGTAALGSWGFALAGLLRAEATLAVANAIFLLLLAGGGIMLPADRLPAAVQGVVALLPSSALGDALRYAVSGPPATGSLIGDVLILTAWAIAGTALAARTFRWE